MHTPSECAELLLKFIQLVAEFDVTLLVVVTVFAQFSNQTVVVVHLLLLVFEHLLIGVLHFLSHFYFLRLGFSLLLFHFYFGLFGFCLGFRTLPPPSEDTAYGTTEEQTENAIDRVQCYLHIAKMIKSCTT